MNKVLLISEDTLKTITNINDNVDGDYILPSIQLAQTIELEETIGTPLTEKLKNLVKENEITAEENVHYKNLLDRYITPFLAYATLTHITPTLAFKLTNAGIVKTDDEKMYNVSFNEVERVKEYYKKIADTYQYRLQRFLIANYGKYKELMEYKSIADLRANLYSAASVGLALGGARGKMLPNPILTLGYGLPSSTIDIK